MNKHIFLMILGCALPLLLIFFAPALGLSSNVSMLIFIIAMFGCHLLMPMHHGTHHHKQEPNSGNPKTENHVHNH